MRKMTFVASGLSVGIALIAVFTCLPTCPGWSMDMQQIAVFPCNLTEFYPSGDANGNGKTEVYGTATGISETLVVFEHVVGDSWARIQTNTRVYGVWAFGDGDGDSLKELLGQNMNNTIVAWESPDLHSFPSESVWAVTVDNGRYGYPRFTDLDLDGRQEIAIRGSFPSSGIRLFENTANNRYESAAVLVNPARNDCEQFDVGDFDRDGYPEVVSGSSTSEGLVNLNECTGRDNEYRLSATCSTGTFETYTVGAAHDMDGDSWPEFLTYGRTDHSSFAAKIEVWEATGNDCYHKVWEYPVESGMWWKNIATGDVDGDGRDEWALNTGNGPILLFDCVGPDSYQLAWTGTGSWSYVGLRDLNDDGKSELIYDTPDNRCLIYEDMSVGASDFRPRQPVPAVRAPSIVHGPFRFDGLTGSSEVELYSTNGRLVQSKAIRRQTSWTWDLTDRHGRRVPASTYFVLIRCQGQTASTKLCVVN
jgi:hypothetical protein